MRIRQIHTRAEANGGSTELLLEVGDIAVRMDFGETVPCEFPIQTGAPVLVEIPPGGFKSFLVGAFSGCDTSRAASTEYAHLIRMPVYRKMTRVDDRKSRPPTDAPEGSLAKTPVVAIAASVMEQVGGKLTQTHSVLPIWSDGTALLATLDWFEGDAEEGTPNGEWHLRASSGLPVEAGFARLEDMVRMAANAQNAHFVLHMSPWLLGAELLADEGEPVSQALWQRRWRYRVHADFASALTRIRRGLLAGVRADLMVA